MKKKLSYREKLLELAYIYDVKEIQEYVKNRKNLTSGQLELILKKDKIQPNKSSNNSEIVNKIIEVLDTKIRPAVARDGGDIKFKSFENGIVKVELQGSCSGCPSSLMTLKQGVQNLLKHYVKEVNSVEAE